MLIGSQAPPGGAATSHESREKALVTGHTGFTGHTGHFWLSQLKEKTCLGPSASSGSLCWSDCRRTRYSVTKRHLGV